MKPHSLGLRLMAVSSPRQTPARPLKPATKRQQLGRLALISALAGAIVAGMAIPFVGITAVATRSAFDGFNALPAQLQSAPLPQRTYMVDDKGQRFATLYKENRIVVPLDKISKKLQDAAIATEDARFYEHNGVDVRGAARALAANSQSGDVAQGSSTITMQYVRNMLITNAKTKEEVENARTRGGVAGIARKLQEMRYAIAVEKELPKDEILEGYLNIAYYGSGAYGAEAASKRYFSKPAKSLNLPQAALLAGLVQRPVGYDPTINPKLARVRRDVVLDRMSSLNMITPKQADNAKQTTIDDNLDVSQPPNGCAESKFPFYCDYVLNQIKNSEAFGQSPEERNAVLERGGLVIETALDRKTQEASEAAIIRRIPKKDPSKKAGASAVVEPGTGAVLALAQNRDWGTEGRGKTTYNYAVNQADGGTIGMQAGSTFKIFTLAAALENGQRPGDMISSPARTTFSSGQWGCGKNGDFFPSYTVNNSTNSGTMNMYTGTAFSVNTYFVELQRRAGLCNTVRAAERMGVTTASGEKLPRVPSFTLGSIEVSPLAVANAYATVAAHGQYCRPLAVKAVKDLTGEGIFSDSGDCHQAIRSEVADSTTAILTGVVDGGIGGRTGQAMSLGRDAAGKTGTTDSNAAVWFAGYTPNVAAAVWVGDPRGGFKYPMRNVTINGQFYGRVYGSTMPGPIWKETMQAALSSRPNESFELDALYDMQPARGGGRISNPSNSNTPWWR